MIVPVHSTFPTPGTGEKTATVECQPQLSISSKRTVSLALALSPSATRCGASCVTGGASVSSVLAAHPMKIGKPHAIKNREERIDGWTEERADDCIVDSRVT